MMPLDMTEMMAFIAFTILRFGLPLLVIMLLGMLAKRIEQLQP